jgi:hypothetical protein
MSDHLRDAVIVRANDRVLDDAPDEIVAGMLLTRLVAAALDDGLTWNEAHAAAKEASWAVTDYSLGLLVRAHASEATG